MAVFPSLSTITNMRDAQAYAWQAYQVAKKSCPKAAPLYNQAYNMASQYLTSSSAAGIGMAALTTVLEHLRIANSTCTPGQSDLGPPPAGPIPVVVAPTIKITTTGKKKPDPPPTAPVARAGFPWWLAGVGAAVWYFFFRK